MIRAIALPAAFVRRGLPFQLGDSSQCLLRHRAMMWVVEFPEHGQSTLKPLLARGNVTLLFSETS